MSGLTLSRIPVAVWLVVAYCVMAALLQLYMPQFIYQRDLMPTEPWRWWTAQWVHVGWRHYLLNVFAFLCLPFIFPYLGRVALMWAVLVLSPLLSISLYWLCPQINAYAGLSGVLHALYAWAALMVLCPSHALFHHSVVRRQPTNSQLHNMQSPSLMQHLSHYVVPEIFFALFVLLAVIFKVLIEKKIGHTDTERLIGAHVLIQAHQIGLVAGIIYFSLLCSWYKFSLIRFSKN